LEATWIKDGMSGKRYSKTAGVELLEATVFCDKKVNFYIHTYRTPAFV